MSNENQIIKQGEVIPILEAKYIEEKVVKEVDGVEQTSIIPSYRIETMEEYEQKVQAREQELQEMMKTIDPNEHTRILIFDNDDNIYRFETDNEIKERIARDKLKRSDKGSSWKERIVNEMKEHNDSWNQIQKIEVKCSELFENEEYADPNKIKEQFDVEWYDILPQYLEWDPTTEWVFHIWTKNRVYFIYDGDYVSSAPRNPSDKE